jgi:hypothetical protein
MFNEFGVTCRKGFTIQRHTWVDVFSVKMQKQFMDKQCPLLSGRKIVETCRAKKGNLYSVASPQRGFAD